MAGRLLGPGLAGRGRRRSLARRTALSAARPARGSQARAPRSSRRRAAVGAAGCPSGAADGVGRAGSPASSTVVERRRALVDERPGRAGQGREAAGARSRGRGCDEATSSSSWASSKMTTSWAGSSAPPVARWVRVQVGVDDDHVGLGGPVPGRLGEADVAGRAAGRARALAAPDAHAAPTPRAWARRPARPGRRSTVVAAPVDQPAQLPTERAEVGAVGPAPRRRRRGRAGRRRPRTSAARCRQR